MCVLGSAGIELIFTSSWLGWPKQPIKWDILYHVMSCSVFKWGAGWRRGFYYSGASWASGGENVAYAFFNQYYWLLFYSPFAIVLNCSHPNPWFFVFFSLLILLLIPLWRGGRNERATVWFFVGNWGKITTMCEVTAWNTARHSMTFMCFLTF